MLIDADKQYCYIFKELCVLLHPLTLQCITETKGSKLAISQVLLFCPYNSPS